MVKISEMPVPNEPQRPYFREGDENIPPGIVNEYLPLRTIRSRPDNLILHRIDTPNERWQRLNHIYLRQITQSYEDVQSQVTNSEQNRFHESLRRASNVLSEIITAVRIRQDQ